jgi:hypothetical protein
MQRLIVSLFCIKKIYHVNEIRVKPERYSNSLGSTLMGMRPNLWASTSSWITDVLFAMKTFSIAIVGTYIQRIKPKSIISINRQALHTRDNEQDMNLQTINIVNQNSDKIDGERERELTPFLQLGNSNFSAGKQLVKPKIEYNEKGENYFPQSTTTHDITLSIDMNVRRASHDIRNCAVLNITKCSILFVDGFNILISQAHFQEPSNLRVCLKL